MELILMTSFGGAILIATIVYVSIKTRNLRTEDIRYAVSSMGYMPGTIEHDIFKLMNEHRDRNGLKILLPDTKLTDKAMERCIEMAKSGKLSHAGFAMIHLDLTKQGADGIGEIIGYGFSGAEGVMNAWKNSEGHNAQMLKAKYQYVGIFVYEFADRKWFTTLFIYDKI